MEIEINKIKYSRATIDDIEILIEYRVRFLNEFFNHSDDEETEILKMELQQYFSKEIPLNSFISWLAEYNGKILGISGMVVWQIPANYNIKSGKRGYILNMYTIPEARRNGISTQLLKKLIKEAKLLGINLLNLHPSEDGMNIYKKAGFIKPDHIELELKLK